MNNKALIRFEIVERRIFIIRGQKVMMDKDLAELYEVKPIRLREQVKRNLMRFPKDFMFQLNDEETDWLLSQFAIPSRKHLGGFNPYVFTEHGVAMLSTVLNSERAIQVNIAIMRAFVKLREMLATNKELAKRLDELEKKYDKQFAVVFEAIRQLMAPPEKPKRQIGFRVEEPKQKYSVRRKR
ncbi:MAG: ORF6N domain-containing protein [Bacteroidetes bacterium]|nr:ORF6N domain-containing protein [Bacteroidota bacterium]MBU2636591.1 ORF6N domain-containing protein [Bacteroidota bacterium]